MPPEPSTHGGYVGPAANALGGPFADQDETVLCRGRDTQAQPRHPLTTTAARARQLGLIP